MHVEWKMESHHVENEWYFSFPSPQFLFCFLVLSSKPSALEIRPKTQSLDGWTVHSCKEKTFLRLSSGLAWYDMEHEFASSLLAYFPEYLN